MNLDEYVHDTIFYDGTYTSYLYVSFLASNILFQMYIRFYELCIE